MKTWFQIENIEEIDSPSLVLYEARLMFNLNMMLQMVKNDATKLMPHVKTNKMPRVIERMVSLGIFQFKASTIAEAEIAARAGAKHVLIAHQLVGPKIARFGKLIDHFPNTEFSTLVDNLDSTKLLEIESEQLQKPIHLYVDINNGMHRSGIELGQNLVNLLEYINTSKNLLLNGLHIYDGHLRQPDFQERRSKVESDLNTVNVFFEALKKDHPKLRMICGGTPTFTAHLKDQDRICSPGTCVFWDWGYGDKLQEQNFKYALLLITRVISKPTHGIVTIDLGHKAVSSENSIDKRVKFLNLKNYTLKSQSEEHGILEVDDWEAINVGDVFYGVPFHVCPTVNLYDEVSVIQNGKKGETWEITARQRKINF